MKKVILVIFSVSLAILAGCDKPENSDTPPVSANQDKSAESKKITMPPSAIKVKFETTKGDIVIELNREKAPVTCANFLNYVREGFYDGVIFHRVIPGFMIQGGGFKPGLEKKKTNPPITNEASNGLGNNRGSISMARLPAPHTATSQFFINLVDNDRLNYAPGQSPGYAVFGKVIEGMDVADRIAGVTTTTIQKSPIEIYKNVPVQDIVIKSATIIK